MRTTIGGADRAAFHVGHGGRKVEIDVVGPMQPSRDGTNGRGWVDAAFGLAPKAAEQAGGIGCRRLGQCFFLVEQSQVFPAWTVSVLGVVFLEDLPLVGLMRQVQRAAGLDPETGLFCGFEPTLAGIHRDGLDRIGLADDPDHPEIAD